MLVRWVDADSVDVLIVASELYEEFITITFGMVDELFDVCVATLVVLLIFPVFAVLKYNRRRAVPVVGGGTLLADEAIMESVSELLEV